MRSKQAAGSLLWAALLLLCLCPAAVLGCDWVAPGSRLGYDRAALRVDFNLSSPAQASSQQFVVEWTQSDCYGCEFEFLYSEDDGRPSNLTFNTPLDYYCGVTSRFTLTVRLLNASRYYAAAASSSLLAEAAFQLTEEGFYTLQVLQAADGHIGWSLLTDAEGDNAYSALLIVFPVLIVILLLCRALVDSRVQARVQQAYDWFVAPDRTQAGELEGAAVKPDARVGVAGDGSDSRQQRDLAEPMLPQQPVSAAVYSTGASGSSTASSLLPVNAVGSDAADGGSGSVSSSAAALVRRSIKGKERLLSLDSFRGLSLSLMIFVNYGGGGYWFFDHASWNGLTVADLLFPWFVWMMGCSMPLSFASLQRQGVGRRAATLKVLRRSAILLLLGLCTTNGGGPFSTMRLMGVLQRFGFSYLIVGLIMLYTPKVGVGRDEAVRAAEEAEREAAQAEDEELAAGGREQQPASSLLSAAYLRRFVLVSPLWAAEYVHHSFEYLAVGVLLLVHLLVTFFLPVPGCPTGYLGPGGRADGGQYWHCVGGAAGYIDRQLLGLNHVYGWPTCGDPYECPAYDPEGLLGILTSAALCYLGVVAGRSILYVKLHQARLARWAVACLVCGLLALALCGGRQNGGFIPVNKNLWSLSFILTEACFGFFMLSLLYVVIDVRHWWDGAPFRPMGQNSILIYVLSETLSGMFPFAWSVRSQGQQSTHLTQLTENVGSVAMFWALAAFCAAKKFFINI